MRRRHRRLTTEAELDVTPFMNLMIVLVPVLLMSVVFAQTTVIELNFPRSGGVASEGQPVRPVVLVRGHELAVTDSEGQLLHPIPALDEGGPDYPQLRQVLKQLKARWPDQKDITVKSSPGTHYQTLVGVMDTVRSFHTVEVTSAVEVALFPNISVGDLPAEPVAEETP